MVGEEYLGAMMAKLLAGLSAVISSKPEKANMVEGIYYCALISGLLGLPGSYSRRDFGMVMDNDATVNIHSE
jgi:hypothetical protein